MSLIFLALCEAQIPQARSEELQATVKAQTEEIAELRGVLDGLEHERDYYFEVGCNVENLCETIQAKSAIFTGHVFRGRMHKSKV